MCGGTGDFGPHVERLGGLSPRVRGNRDFAGSAVNRVGSIPACAGEPNMDGTSDWVGGVYPRVCGGTRPAIPPERDVNGLSPRVRGNLSCAAADGSGSRSIPACAGEP